MPGLGLAEGEKRDASLWFAFDREERRFSCFSAGDSRFIGRGGEVGEANGLIDLGM